MHHNKRSVGKKESGFVGVPDKENDGADGLLMDIGEKKSGNETELLEGLEVVPRCGRTDIGWHLELSVHRPWILILV